MSEPYLDPRVAEMSAATGLTYVQVARFASIAGHKLSNYAALALVGELVRRRKDALFSFYPATGMIVITVPSREATFSFVSDALLEEVYVQGTWCDSLGRHRSGTTSLPRGAVRALRRALKLDWVAARISDAATQLRKRGQLGLPHFETLIRKIARIFAWQQDDQENLVQEGLSALWSAVRKYDAGRGNGLAPFAASLIRSEMMRYRRENLGPVRIGSSRNVAKARRFLPKAVEEFRQIGLDPYGSAAIEYYTALFGIDSATAKALLETTMRALTWPSRSLALMRARSRRTGSSGWTEVNRTSSGGSIT